MGAAGTVAVVYGIRPEILRHVKSILRKLRARDRTHAVAISFGMATDVRSGDSGMAGLP